MNDDSDESEYVDDIEHESVDRKPRARAKKNDRKRSKNARIKREASRDSSAALEDQPGFKDTKNAATAKIKSDTLRAYRDLLNANIAEVLEPSGNFATDAFSPSQIGLSFWTSKEKHRILEAIRSRGPGDLSALASAVHTKAEPEIKAYILLLQEGVRELDAKATQQFGLADVPAAIETEPDLLEAEEALAVVVERRARAVEEAREKERLGEESWLIDEDVAAAIDERFGGPDDEDTENHEDEEGQAERVPTTLGNGGSDSASPLPDELLKASTLLELSRTLFMNSKNLEMNWHTISEEDESEPRPSIRRTAFDDFHNLVVSLTRRFMQASIFQAMSRLRASSDQRLLPHVNAFDVAAARETMGLKTQRPEYWAAAVKRCGVEVFSDSKKWRAQEGRRGTKNGFKLNDFELKAELEVLLPDEAAHANALSDGEDNDSDAESSDSDAYTVASSSGRSDNEESDAEVAMDARGRVLTDRRRPLSPASFHRAETKYLERVDRHKAAALDDEYRHTLDLPITAHKRTSKPGFPYKQADIEARPKDWRAVIQYEAPWEQPQGMPVKRDFDAMDTEGARRSKRRRLVADKSGAAISDNENTSQRDPNVVSEVEDGTEAESGTRSSSESGSDDDEEGNKDNSASNRSSEAE